MNSGFLPLGELFKVPTNPPAPLSMVVARIVDIYPASPRSGGSQQQISIALGTGAAVIFANLFDQSCPVPMSLAGGVIRASAGPQSSTAIVWERSKASRMSNVGTLVMRKSARVELFTESQARQLGICEHGFMRTALVATPEQAPALQPELLKPYFTPTATTSPSTPSIPPISENVVMSTTLAFYQCLQAAKDLAGPHNSPDDVRCAATAVFSRLRSVA